MKLSFNVYGGIDPNMLKAPCKNAEKVLAVQVQKDTRPYVPMLTGSLNQRSYVDGNLIVYPGPYARYLYEGKRMVNSVTGKGPRYIKEVGYRWPRGATLVATSEPLNYTTDFHANAQDHWFEASKKANLPKWQRVLKEAIKQNV